jgi:hypothetical protein
MVPPDDEVKADTGRPDRGRNKRPREESEIDTTPDRDQLETVPKPGKKKRPARAEREPIDDGDLEVVPRSNATIIIVVLLVLLVLALAGIGILLLK